MKYLSGFYVIIFCLFANSNFIFAQKINGICLVGPFEESEQTHPIIQIKTLNANWLGLVPEARLDRVTLDLNENLKYNWAIYNEGYIKLIQEAKREGLKVFLKPHIRLDNNISWADKIKRTASWRGEIEPENQQDWTIIEEKYTEYILNLAEIAEAQKVEIFCIGTELKSFTAKRPEYWRELICNVRGIYSGKVTYSANWDNYKNIGFWNELDFIGMNAYFPVSNASTPSTYFTKRKWGGIKQEMENLSNRLNKKILITEYGYKSAKFAGAKPWIHNSENESINNQAQANLLKSALESLWTEQWVEGGFLWNWNYKSLPSGNTDFSVQNKPSENIVKQYYLEYQ